MFIIVTLNICIIFWVVQMIGISEAHDMSTTIKKLLIENFDTKFKRNALKSDSKKNRNALRTINRTLTIFLK